MSLRGLALFVGGGLANTSICLGIRLLLGQRILHLGPPEETLWRLPASQLYAWMALVNLPIWLWMCALGLMLLRRRGRGMGQTFVWIWLGLSALFCVGMYLIDVSCLPLPPEVGFNTCGL